MMELLPQADVEWQTFKRIVLIDDDDLFRDSLGLNLLEEGYEVVDFACGEAALEYLSGDHEVDIILLDWCMPGFDGLKVLLSLRQQGIATPVVILTVMLDQVLEEAALKLGAIDFIDKSRRFSILLKRLELICAGTKSPARGEISGPPQIIRHGALELRDDVKRAWWNGTQIDLTLSEFAIVQLLASRPGADMTYRRIYDLVRGKNFAAGYGSKGYYVNVRSFIKRIRQKFRAIDPTFDRIESYAGYGYRWRKEEDGRLRPARERRAPAEELSPTPSGSGAL